jgi:hypothetical protein
MKRQRGRNRGGNGAQGGNNGGKPQQHNANRSFESNGPDNVKIRGNAQHVFEKYQQLARDASSSGDRVLAENYLQHAEHYFRVVRAVQPNRPVADIIGRDSISSGYDIDFDLRRLRRARRHRRPTAIAANSARSGASGRAATVSNRIAPSIAMTGSAVTTVPATSASSRIVIAMTARNNGTIVRARTLREPTSPAMIGLATIVRPVATASAASVMIATTVRPAIRWPWSSRNPRL